MQLNLTTCTFVHCMLQQYINIHTLYIVFDKDKHVHLYNVQFQKNIHTPSTTEGIGLS